MEVPVITKQQTQKRKQGISNLPTKNAMCRQYVDLEDRKKTRPCFRRRFRFGSSPESPRTLYAAHSNKLCPTSYQARLMASATGRKEQVWLDMPSHGDILLGLPTSLRRGILFVHPAIPVVKHFRLAFHMYPVTRDHYALFALSRERSPVSRRCKMFGKGSLR